MKSMFASPDSSKPKPKARHRKSRASDRRPPEPTIHIASESEVSPASSSSGGEV